MSKHLKTGEAAAESITEKHLQDKVISFSSRRNSVIVRGQDINIDPHILWHGLSLLIQNNKDRELYFAFELAPEQGFMTKAQEAVMGAILKE